MVNSPKNDLSVIILSYNTADFLDQCLRSVKKAIRETKENQIEVIVVDNASKDRSVATVRQKHPWVKLVVSKKNLGFSGGNNLGLQKANGRLILFLNSDTEVYPKSLARVIKFMKRRPRAGALSAKTLLANRKMDPDCHRGFPTPLASLSYFLGLEKLFPQSRFFGGYHQGFKDLNRHHQIDAGAGAFMVIRDRVIDQVGGWDEDYFFYGEDLDFFYRIKKAGWEVWFYAQPLLVHYKGVSSGLRKESKKISQADRETRLRAAKASVGAMEVFYRKFYSDQYPKPVTSLILAGIRLKGHLRYLVHYFRR